MKNVTLERRIREPVRGDPTGFLDTRVEVELRAFVPNYESLPDSEEARYRPLLEGFLQLECEARQAGLWFDVLERCKPIDDHWERLQEMDRLFKSLRKGA